MKLAKIIILVYFSGLATYAQFYAPDTEYHDSVQRIFPVEGARVLAWIHNLSKNDIAQVDYSILTRSDQTTVWEIRCLDRSGTVQKTVKIEYPKTLLDSGADFYREVFRQLWHADLCEFPLSSRPKQEVLSSFWTGAESIGLGREESVLAALKLGKDMKPEQVSALAPELAAVLTHAALPSIADRLTLDNSLIARGAAWLALAEQATAEKTDVLWVPTLFLACRDRTAGGIWQKEVPVGNVGKPLAQQFWDMIFRGPSTRDAYLFAADSQNVQFAAPLLAYDVTVNQTPRLLADLLPDLARTPQTLARWHNFAPLVTGRTTVGGGHIFDGAWPAESRSAWLALLAGFPNTDKDLPTFAGMLQRVRKALSALKPTSEVADASLYGLHEAAGLLQFAHKEGVGPLTPCGILTLRDALNFGWEMAGLQMGARYSFALNRWGVPELAQAIYKSCTSEVEGWIPFFKNQRRANISNYSDSLRRLQMLDGSFQRVGASSAPFGADLSPAEGVRLWIKRCWMRPRDFEWQVRSMWDAKILGEAPDLITALNEGAGGRAAVEVLKYFRSLNLSDLREIPRAESLQYSLGDLLPEPNLLYVVSVSNRDFSKLDAFTRGQRFEKLFWRNPDGELEERILRAYLAPQADRAARRFYFAVRSNLGDPVAFSQRLGKMMWMLGYITNDPKLREAALEDSRSGSFADMTLNIWESAMNNQDSKLAPQADELIERYEQNEGNNSQGRILRRFLPLLPALKNPRDPRRQEALTFFGKDIDWAVLRWIWIENFKIPVNDAITFLGGKENDTFRGALIAYLENDQPRALQQINAFNNSRGVDELGILLSHVYARIHGPRPEPPSDDLKPAEFKFTREAVAEKIKAANKTSTK